MLNLKQSKILKSFRFKLVAAIILLGVALTLFFILKSKPKLEPSVDTNRTDSSSISNEDKNIKPADLKSLQLTLDKDIDSIFSSFGIKKEWISTYSAGGKNPNSNTKSPQPKRNSKEAAWFVKDILIPKDLTSAEVNLDLSLFVKGSGLTPQVNEDIRTKDIVFDIFQKNDSSSGLPLGRIYISHSEKISRETGVYCIILNNINEYKKDDLDKILNTTSEFSYVFPRNLENVELQNRLIQSKKDIIINLTASTKDNSDADFSSADEKEIRQRVKSFNVDFPSMTRVILTKSESAPPPPAFMNKIIDELSKFGIKAITDSSLTSLNTKAEEDSKDKVKIIINNLKSKTAQLGKGISILTLSYDDFTKLYDEMLVLKKLGYKFYNLNEYISKEADKQKKEKLKDEKLKDELAKDKKEDTKREIKKDTKDIKKQKPKTETKPKPKNDTKKPTAPKKK